MNLKKQYRRRTIGTLILVTLLILPFWVDRHFGHMDFIQVLFLALSDAQGGVIEWSLVFSFIKLFGPFYIITILIYYFYYRISFNNYIYTTRFINKGKKINLRIRFTKKRILITVGLVFAITIVNFNRQLKILSFFADNNKVTDLYETYYADPNKTELTWPKKKQNLIHIVLESMETGFADMSFNKEETNLIPNLQDLSEGNISFRHNENFSGALQLKGTSWTVASLLSQTAGVPIQISKFESGFGEKFGFLPGVTTLGELLEDQGYENYFMAGSDANFGGRETYFKTHGNYKILDTKYYKEIGKIPEDYEVFWGFEDQKLFEFAKEELNYLASQDKPFNLTMLTVDTHFTDGYTDEACDLEYESMYANAISCSDKKIQEFIQWIQEQDFYEDTTIVITGDHFTMNHDFTKNLNSDDRTIYNAIINPKIDEINPARLVNRQFSTMDFFPTTLASLGVNIEGERLGLGTNLYSKRPALIEEIGLDELEEKIGQNSNYYNENFMLIDLN